MRDNTDVVAAVKAELEGRGVALNSPCGAFEITKRVAWRLKDEGAGMLAKPSGNNCGGFAVDVVCYRDGTWVDILVNSETENRPAWQVGQGKQDVSRWVAPTDPGDQAPAAPAPPAAPPASDDELTKLVEAGGSLQDAIVELMGAVEALTTRIANLQTNGLRLRL